MANTQKIEMEVTRKDGKTIFKFKVPSAVTAIYKSLSVEEKESANWKGLKFYSIPSMTDDSLYRNHLSRYNLIDDFGTKLYAHGCLNIAWLRTVAGEGQIVVPDSISFADFSIMIKNCTTFVKQHFEQHYTNFKITGSISLEI